MNLVLLRFGPRLTDTVGNYFAGSGDDLQSMDAEEFDREAGLPTTISYGGTNEKSPLTPNKDLTEYQKKMLSVRSSVRKSRPSLL